MSAISPEPNAAATRFQHAEYHREAPNTPGRKAELGNAVLHIGGIAIEVDAATVGRAHAHERDNIGPIRDRMHQAERNLGAKGLDQGLIHESVLKASVTEIEQRIRDTTPELAVVSGTVVRGGLQSAGAAFLAERSDNIIARQAARPGGRSLTRQDLELTARSLQETSPNIADIARLQLLRDHIGQLLLAKNASKDGKLTDKGEYLAERWITLDRTIDMLGRTFVDATVRRQAYRERNERETVATDQVKLNRLTAMGDPRLVDAFMTEVRQRHRGQPASQSFEQSYQQYQQRFGQPLHYDRPGFSLRNQDAEIARRVEQAVARENPINARALAASFETAHGFTQRPDSAMEGLIHDLVQSEATLNNVRRRIGAINVARPKEANAKAADLMDKQRADLEIAQKHLEQEVWTQGQSYTLRDLNTYPGKNHPRKENWVDVSK